MYVEGYASDACNQFVMDLEWAIDGIDWEIYLGDEPYYWKTEIVVLACVEV